MTRSHLSRLLPIALGLALGLSPAAGAPAFAQDTDPPVIEVLQGGAALADGALFVGPVTITVQVTDASQVTVDSTLDGAPFASGSTVGGEGSHELVVTATDDAQNQASVTLGFEIDTVAPVFGPVLPASGTLTSAADVTLQGEVTGAASVTVDGAAANLVGADWSAGPFSLTEGERTFAIVATDAAGNEAQIAHRIVRDSTPPSVSIDQPAASVPQKTVAVDVVGTAADPHLESVTVGGTAASRTGSTFLARNVPLAEGANTVTAEATDAAGNSAQASRSIVLDTQSPAVAITDPAAGTVLPSATITVSGSATDPHLDRVEVNGVPATLTGGTWSGTASLAEGANTLTVEAFDRLGWSATATVSVTRDTTSPAVTITAPTDGSYLQGDTVAVSGTVDDAGATVTVNGIAAPVDGGATPPTFAATVPLVEGENRLIARVTDAVGNQGARARVVYRDTVAPTLERVDPGDGALAVPPESHFELTFSEPLGTLAPGAWSLELANGTAIPAQGTVDGAVLVVQPDALLLSKTEVRLVLTAAVVDRAGNALAAPPTLSWRTEDVEAPDAPVLAAQPPGYLCAAEIALSGSAEAEAVVEATGGASGGSVRAGETGDFALVVELVPGGLNRLELTAVDVDGNRSAATVVEVVQDCRGPVITDAVLTGDTVSVAFDETIDPATVGAASVLLTAASGAIAGTVTSTGTEATFTADAPLPAEPLRLEVTTAVRDLAGNPLSFPYVERFGAAVTPSFLSGRVIDAATGRPLGGASVVIDSTDGVVNAEPRPEQTTGSDGRFRIPVASGTHYLVALRPGYTPVFRLVPATGGEGADVFDPRLTPAAPAQTVSTAGGVFTGDDGLALDFAAGALAANAQVSVTPLDEQALPAPLPYGWSPRGAVWIDLGGAALSAPATLTLPVSAAPGAPLALVRLDLTTLQWHVEAVENLTGASVTLPVDGEGAWAAVEADGGAVAPPAPVAGTVLGSAPAPAGTEVTAAAISFDPASVLPSQTSRATVTYTLAADAPSGAPLTVVVREELTLLDGTVRREPPYEADLVLYRSSPSDPLTGSDARSSFDLMPSAVARSTPFEVGAEDVAVRPYAGQSVQGNVIGPTGGAVATAEGDRVDLPVGALAEPAPVLLERVAEADLQIPPPVGTQYLGALQLDLSGRGLASAASLTLELGAAPAVGEQGLLFRIVDLGGIDGPVYRPVAMLTPTATGWSTAPIDPLDLPWPGVRSSGTYLFARLVDPVGYLRGTVFGIGGAPAAGARIGAADGSTAVPWVQLSDDSTEHAGAYVLPVPVAAVTVAARNPATGDEAHAAATVAAADERVDLDLFLQVTDPQVVSVDPADGATEVLTGIEPTVTFSEPVDPTTVTQGVQLFDAADGVPVPAAVEVQGGLVRLRPLASLRPATLHEVRVNTAVRDLQGNRLAAAVTSAFTTRDDSANTQLDLTRIHLFEPDGTGDARVLGRAGAVPAGTLVFVENLSRLIATPSVTAAGDGGFELLVEATLEDRLLLHVVLDGQNEVVVELTPFLTANGQAARIVDEEAETVFTTLDGITVRVPADTFRRPTTVTVEPRALDASPAPVPGELTALYAYELDFGGAEAFRAVEIAVPAPPAGTPGLDSERFFLMRTERVLGEPYWMLYDLMVLDGGAITTELPPEELAGLSVPAGSGEELARLASASGPWRSLGGVGRVALPEAIETIAAPVRLGDQKDYLPGSANPGLYTVMYENTLLDFVGMPTVAGSFAFFSSLGVEGIITRVDAKILSLLERDAILLPTRAIQDVTIVARDLTTGYKLWEETFAPPAPGEILFLPPDAYGDLEAPAPVTGSPLRFYALTPASVGTTEIAPGIEVELAADDQLFVRGEAGAAGADVEVRLIGLADEDDGTAVDVTGRTAPESAADAGSFTVASAVTPGRRYLLAIGAEVASDAVLEIGFSEGLDPALPGIAVTDSTGRDAAPEIEPLSGGQVVRIAPTAGWVAGRTYTLKLAPELADAAGNAWGRDLDLELRVRSSEPRDTYELAAVRDVARIGALLFVAADEDGLVVLDASDPASLEAFVSDGTADYHFPFPYDDPVRGVAVDPHGRVLVVGGGVGSFGQLKIFDPLAIDPAAIAAAPGDLAVRTAAYRGSTIVSDKLGGVGTQLPEGTPRRVAVLSQDRRDTWRIGVEAPPAGIILDPPAPPDGATEYAVTVSASGPAPADGYLHPVTLRNQTRGQWRRVDATATGAFSLTATVGVGDTVELIRNDRTLAYVATLGVGLEVVDVDAFYDEAPEDPQNPGPESDVLGIYTGYEEGLELCNEPVSHIGGATVDLGTLFDPDPLAAHPLTAVGLIGFRGLAMLESDPADVGAISFYGELCLEIEGSARVTGMEVLEDYAFDLDGDERLEEDEERDYLLVTHLTAGLLVIDATDRDALALAGRVRLPGSASHLGVDRSGRRVFVAAAGEGVYVVDLDDRPTTQLLDRDQDGVDDRVLETIELEGGTNAPVFLVPELGLAYAGGLDRGLTSIAIGEPRIFTVAENAPDPATGEPPEVPHRQVDRLAPFGVPSAPEADGEELPGAFRVVAHLPGGAGAEVRLDLVSLGPGGAAIRGAGDPSVITGLPSASLEGTDGLKLTRLSDDPLDEGYQIYVSEEIAALADLRASVEFVLTPAEEQWCTDEARRCDAPEEAREILSGHSIAVRFPDTLRTTLGPLYGTSRLDAAELELASVAWDTSPAIRQEPALNPAIGTGDVAPGTLLHSGEYSHKATDLMVKSRGFDFVFTRTYRSQTVGAGPLGPGWDFQFGQRLRELPNGDVEYYDGRGRREVYERQEDGSLKPPPGRFATLDGGGALARTSAGWLLLTRHGHRVRFDRFGRLTSIADAVKDSEDTGNEMRLQYDARSRLVHVLDTLDRAYTLEYDAYDRLVALEDFDERRVEYGYDGAGRLSTVTSPAVGTFGGGLVTSYAYLAEDPLEESLAKVLTARDQLVTITDPRGTAWLGMTWTDADGDGRVEEVTGQQWGTGTLSITYDLAGGQAQVTDRRGHTTYYQLDSGGLTTSVHEPGGYVSSFEYDADGNMTRSQTPAGIVRTFEYNGTGGERSGGNVTEARTSPGAGGENGSATLLSSTLDYHGRTNRPTRTVDPRGTVVDIARTPGGLPQTIVRGAGQPNAPTTSVEYDDHGQPTRIVNANGHVTELHYYESGPSRGYLQRQIVDPSGLALTTTFETDARGNVTAVTDPPGVRHETEYNELDWVVAEREPSLGYETRYVHDRNGNVVEEHRPVGDGSQTAAIVRTYGALDEVLSISMEAVAGSPDSAVVQTFEYDANLNPIQVVRPAGQVSTATYDGRDLMTGLIHSGSGLALPVPETFGYDADGRRDVYTDGRGETWTSQYDGYGRPAVVSDPLGRSVATEYDDGSSPTVSLQFDAQGCLITRTDASYDALGRQLSATAWAWEENALAPPECAGPPASARALVTGFQYDPLGNLLTTTDPLGRVTLAAYDEAERLVRVEDAAGNVTSFALDDLGNVLAETVQEQTPGGSVATVVTSHLYDPLGRRTQTIDGAGNPWQVRYDAQGNVVLEIDPEGNFTARAFDALGRMTSQTRPEDIRIESVYDPSGRLTVYRDALGNETTYGYDALDRQISVTYPDQTSESFEYDVAGNLTRSVDPLGNVVVQAFDDAGRLTSRSVIPAAGVLGPTSESYVYDAADRLVQATSGAVTTARAYDSLGRILSETTGGRTIEYAYDDAGNEIALGYPSGLVLGREFDPLNRPSAIGTAAGLPAFGIQAATVDPFARFGFRGAGLVASKALGTGLLPAIESTMLYDDARRLVSATVEATGSNQTVFGETLTWNARSLKTGQARADRNGASLAFTYDRAGRLTDATRAGGGASFELPDAWGFTLDAAENLLTRETRRSTRIEREPMPLDGSGRNRPGSVDGVVLEWDANGNLTRKGETTFAYDYRNRLTEVRDGTGLVASYTYDAFNRRIGKTIGSTTTETVWTGWQALEEYRNGTLSARRSFGLGLDEMVRVEADVEGDGTLESEYHPLYDSTGNLVMALGTDGEPIELYAYSPFGERQVIVNDLMPPAVEQVRIASGALWIELSEEVDAEGLTEAFAEGDASLTDTGASATVPLTLSWPVTEGPSARRRVVLTPQTAPADGTALELTIAAGALEDLFGNETAAASTDTFTWPAGDAVLRDTTAPRVESVTVEQGRLVVGLSEEPAPAAATAAIALDGQPLTWTLGADRYTLTSQETLASGSHTVTVDTTGLDLAGLGLTQTFEESFTLAVDETDRLVFETPDPTLSTTSTIANHYGFHGRPIDPETGLLYFRNRYYDPEMGRFISTDPLGYVDGPNLYQYGLNNPASFSDPLGLRALGDGAGPIGPIARDTLVDARRLQREKRERMWREDVDTVAGALALVDQVGGDVSDDELKVALNTYLQGRPRYDRWEAAELIATIAGRGNGLNAVADELTGMRAFAEFAQRAPLYYLTAASGAADVDAGIRSVIAFSRSSGWRRLMQKFAADTASGSQAGPVLVPRGAAGLSDDILQLAERNLTGSGDTVLGSYPGYINKANARGASYFDVGDAWETLTPVQRKAANNHFLDIIASRGDRVLLSVSKYQIQQGTALADEVAYLTSQKGYVWVNQWSLKPGG